MNFHKIYYLFITYFLHGYTVIFRFINRIKQHDGYQSIRGSSQMIKMCFSSCVLVAWFLKGILIRMFSGEGKPDTYNLDFIVFPFSWYFNY